MTRRQIGSVWFLWEYGPPLPLVERLQWFLYRVAALEIPTIRIDLFIPPL